MQPSKRQCWDVMRKLVKEKNAEYQRFLGWNFNGDSVMRTICQGHTRDYFLGNYGIVYDENSMGKDWLKNLSAEDLLIFLDFRCKLLQQLYKITGFDGRFGKNTLSEGEICEVISKTPLNKYARWEDGEQKLMLTGRPKKTKREANVEDIKDFVRFKNLAKDVLQIVMGNLYYNYLEEGENYDEIDEVSNNIVTTTFYVNDRFPHGIKFNGRVKLPDGACDECKQEFLQGKIIGFDSQYNPIRKIGLDLYDVNGKLCEQDDVVYDSETIDYFQI